MIVAGFGFRAAASADSLRSALNNAANGRQPDLLAAPADKCAAAPMQTLAAQLNLPLRPVSPAELAQQDTNTHSAPSQAHRGTGSVCEAAALAAAGASARLLTTREISEDRLATCSFAIGNPS